MWKVIAAAVLFFIFSGCAMNPRVESLTPAQRSRIAAIKVFKTDIQRPYFVVGQVDGLSCDRNVYQEQDVTYGEAMQGVRIRAILLDADAVINVVCQRNTGTDWTNNCWASIKCFGDAVKYK